MMVPFAKRQFGLGKNLIVMNCHRSYFILSKQKSMSVLTKLSRSTNVKMLTFLGLTALSLANTRRLDTCSGPISFSVLDSVILLGLVLSL